jgi:ATP-dependent exoDNAse (exonuclease V) alpha subunit
VQKEEFPIRLDFSLTINKSQEQTFDKICLYLPKSVFSHGQLYVALSRVRSLGSLSVVSETNEIFNCVYNEIYE